MRAVLDAVAAKHQIDLSYTEFDWSCQRYEREGAMMPDDGIETLRGFDAILLGAVGWPGVPDHVSLWGLLIPIRRAFRQYVNLRPIKVFDGVDSPLRQARDVDFVGGDPEAQKQTALEIATLAKARGCDAIITGNGG